MKILFVVTALLFLIALASSPALAQPNTQTEEAQNLIEMAQVTFMTCNWAIENVEYDLVNFYLKQKCDHDILFLKGICESNNNADSWCFDGEMQRFLNVRGLNDAPRPPDTWCNMNIDACIAMNEETIKSMQEIGVPGSESMQNLVSTFEDKIQELEDQKAAQGDNENDDNDNDNDD